MHQERYEQGRRLRRQIPGDQYCAIPAALDSFRLSEQVFSEQQRPD
jgi:hypothetical protein